MWSPNSNHSQCFDMTLSSDPAETWHGQYWVKSSNRVKETCPICEEQFATRLSLWTHIKMHQLPTCHECWTIFEHEADLNIHEGFCHMNAFIPPSGSEISDSSGDSDDSNDLGNLYRDDSSYCREDRRYWGPPSKVCDVEFRASPGSFGFTSTPKETNSKKIRARRQPAAASREDPPKTPVVKNIVTRSGRKINFKFHD